MRKSYKHHLTVALAASLSFLLMLIEVPIPIFPVFLKMDISDLPALLISLTLGPISAIAVEFLKNLLHGITAGSSAYIGETANFLIGAVFVWTVGTIFRIKKTSLSLVLALLAGTIAMSISAAFLNYFILLPLYEALLGFPVKAVIAGAAETNPLITSPFTFLLWAIIPFNLIKGFLLSILCYYTVKKLRII